MQFNYTKCLLSLQPTQTDCSSSVLVMVVVVLGKAGAGINLIYCSAEQQPEVKISHNEERPPPCVACA